MRTGQPVGIQVSERSMNLVVVCTS